MGNLMKQALSMYFLAGGYYNIPTKIYKSFYEQNTEKFLGIFPYGQNLVKMHRKDGQWRNTNRNYTENGFMMKKTLTKGRKL